jgi:hypothetical protein
VVKGGGICALNFLWFLMLFCILTKKERKQMKFLEGKCIEEFYAQYMTVAPPPIPKF